jgi:hypothetical protein
MTTTNQAPISQSINESFNVVDTCTGKHTHANSKHFKTFYDGIKEQQTQNKLQKNVSLVASIHTYSSVFTLASYLTK